MKRFLLIALAIGVAGCGDKTTAPSAVTPVASWQTRSSPLSIALSHDGSLLAVHEGVRVVLFRPATGESLATAVIDSCPPICDCGISPSNVVFSPDDRQASAGALSNLVRMDIPSGAVHDSLVIGHRFQLGSTGVEYGPDGQLIYVLTDDGELSIWNASTGALVMRHPHEADFYPWCLAISPDGAQIAMGGSVQRMEAVRLYDRNDLSSFQTLVGDSGDVTNLAFAPNGTRLASGGFAAQKGQIEGAVSYWDLRSGTEIWKMVSPNLYLDPVMALSPDGSWLTADWKGGQLALISTRSGGVQTRWQAHDSRGVSATAFSPLGNLLVSAGFDGSVKVWDLGGVLAER